MVKYSVVKELKIGDTVKLLGTKSVGKSFEMISKTYGIKKGDIVKISDMIIFDNVPKYWVKTCSNGYFLSYDLELVKSG